MEGELQFTLVMANVYGTRQACSCMTQSHSRFFLYLVCVCAILTVLPGSCIINRLSPPLQQRPFLFPRERRWNIFTEEKKKRKEEEEKTAWGCVSESETVMR